MKVKISNDVLAVEDGTYTATIDTIQEYGDEGRILLKLLLSDNRMLLKFYKLDDLGAYPWSTLFRALNSNDTDDLIGQKVEIEIVNNVSKISGNEFCNIRKIRLI